MLEVSVSGSEAQLAANYANAIGEQTRNYAQEFYSIYGIKVLDTADVPREPVRNVWMRELGVGGLLGLLLGLGMALLLNYLRQWKRNRTARLSRARELEHYS